MKDKTKTDGVRRIYQGTESERLALRRKVLLFSIVCLICTAGAFFAGLLGSGSQFHYMVFAVGEAVMSVVLTVLAILLASQKDHLRESLYRWTVAAIPGICLALILFNVLTVIAALVRLGRYGAQESKLLFLLAALLLRLVCMECAHLCRKTVTHSVWTINLSE